MTCQIQVCLTYTSDYQKYDQYLQQKMNIFCEKLAKQQSGKINLNFY